MNICVQSYQSDSIFIERVEMTIGAFVRGLDLFGTTKFITYKGQNQYNTICGGFISLLLIVGIFLLAITELIEASKMNEVISSTTTNIRDLVPTYSNVAFEGSKQFQFAIFLPYQGINFTDYFDIQGTFYVGADEKATFDFVPCVRENFAHSDDTLQYFDQIIKYTQAFCPPNNMSGRIGGKQNDKDWGYLQITVTECSKKPNCKSKEEIAALINDNPLLNDDLVIAVPFVSTIINPIAKQYKTIFIDSSIVLQYKNGNTAILQAYITEAQMSHDTSFLPWKIIEYQAIIGMKKKKDIFDGIKINNTIASIVFTKSPERVKYTQTFKKIDAVIAYIGGLFGSLIPVFFVFTWFSEKSYRVSAAQKIFRYDNQNEIDSKGFNFLQFAKITVRRFLQKCKVERDCKKTDIYQAADQSMAEQLSIDLILRQLKYVMAAISLLLTQNQLKALHLIERESLMSAFQTRKYFYVSHKYFFDKSLKQVKKKYSEQDQIQKNKDEKKEFEDQIGKEQINQGDIQTGSNMINPNSKIQQQILKNPPGQLSHARIKYDESQIKPNEQSEKKKQKEKHQKQKARNFLVEEEIYTAQLLANLQYNIVGLIQDAKRGNYVSFRIVQRLSKKVLMQMKLQETVQDLKREFGEGTDQGPRFIDEDRAHGVNNQLFRR